MTPAKILADVRETLTDAVAPYRWSDARLVSYLVEGQLEACRRARLIEDRTTPAVCDVALVAEDAIVDVDPRVLFIRRAKLVTADVKLAKVDTQALDRSDSGWEVAASVEVPRWWTPWGDHQVRIEKIAGADTLHLWVVREPLLAPKLASAALAVTSVTSAAGVATVVLTNANEDMESGDTMTLAGATPSDYNGAKVITVIDSTHFTFPVTGSPTSPATGTITATLSAVSPEIPARYHARLADWICYRAMMTLDEEKRDDARAKYHLGEFEAEFGKRSSAQDETWIQRKHGYDEDEGLY